MDIIAITVCVNFSDILKHMLNNNSRFFKKWYIVTSPEDSATYELIKDVNIPNIHLLIYEGFYTNAIFNKGGAVRFVQEYINTKYESSNILILDSDIYLPNDFMDYLPKSLDDDVLYGPSIRKDYLTLDDFMNNINQEDYTPNYLGFFQLYKSSTKYLYENSNNCSLCDFIFRGLFKTCFGLNISVKHLGQRDKHWNGRILGSL